MRFRLFFVFCLLLSMMSCDEQDAYLKKQTYLQAINDSIAADKNKIAYYLERAQLLEEQAEYSYALRDYERVMQGHPSVLVGLKKYRALQHIDTSLARQWVQKMLRDFPQSEAVETSYARYLIENKDSLAVSLILDRQWALYKDGHRASWSASDWADLAYQNQEYDLAAIFCRAALLQDTLSESGFLLAQIQILQHPKKALKFIDSLAVWHGSASADIFFLKANYYQKQALFGQAIVYYKRAINLDWKDQLAYIEKARCEKKMKQYERALSTLTTASRVARSSASLLYEIVDVYLLLKDTLLAQQYIAPLLSIDSSYSSSIQQRLTKPI